MPDFLAQAALLKNEEFLGRIKIAIKKVATQIEGEVQDPNKPELNEKRHKLGYDVLNNDMTQKFAEAIVSANTDINVNSTDSDLEFMASSIWNDIAGVKDSED